MHNIFVNHLPYHEKVLKVGRYTHQDAVTIDANYCPPLLHSNISYRYS